MTARRQRNTTIESIQCCEREKELKVARNFNANPKMLHNFVRSKIKVRKKIGSLENPSGEICCDSKE